MAAPAAPSAARSPPETRAEGGLMHLRLVAREAVQGVCGAACDSLIGRDRKSRALRDRLRIMSGAHVGRGRAYLPSDHGDDERRTSRVRRRRLGRIRRVARASAGVLRRCAFCHPVSRVWPVSMTMQPSGGGARSAEIGATTTFARNELVGRSGRRAKLARFRRLQCANRLKRIFSAPRAQCARRRRADYADAMAGGWPHFAPGSAPPAVTHSLWG